MRILSLSAVVVAAAAVLVGVPAAAAPDWQSCPDNPATFCTTLAVPVDWATPGGDRFGMAVARRPAAGDRTGTIVYLPAGPGSSGVDAVTNDQIFGLLFPPAIAEHFDVVSFDPRGVRRSNAVTCDAALVEQLDRPAPRDQREFSDLLAAQATVGTDCRARTGPLFDHLDSTQVARDVDALRTALGEPTLNLYALSYGTVAGQSYAELFPRRIRTMVLDGVFDHTVDSDRFALTGALAAQESFDQFVSWCDNDPTCELHGTDIRARVADLFATTADPEALTSRLVAPLTRPDLPAVAHEIAHPTEGTTTTTTTTTTAATTPLPIYLQCADNQNRTTTYAHAALLADRARQVAPDVRGPAFDLAMLCVNPPVPASNPQRPLHAPNVPPVLVLNSRYDPATPHQGARHVTAQLPGAVLVTYDGLGHGAATRTACTAGLMTTYVTNRTLPAPDTHCAASNR